MSFSSTVVRTESETNEKQLQDIQEIDHEDCEINQTSYQKPPIDLSPIFEYCKSMRIQTLVTGAFAVLIGCQLIGKILLPHLLNRFRNQPELIKIKEAEIDLTHLFASYNRQFAMLQQYNDSMYHDFRVNVNETTSTVTISSSIVTTSKNLTTNTSTRTLQISSLKIRMANLSNADLTLSTQFISSSTEPASLAERHQEFVNEL